MTSIGRWKFMHDIEIGILSETQVFEGICVPH